MSLPTPDLKPHVAPQPPGSEGCGCCAGIAAATPQALFNRGGLSAVGYRIGDWAQFRASLHASLSSSNFAPLAALRTRDGADFTIGLVDAFACAADLITFYQERIANESWLRTAVERVSLQEMGKLIGYRLRPGVAAETWLAFALDTPPVAPATLAPEPGNFVSGVPASLTLAAGLKVQSVPGPDEKPQTFETAQSIEARPGWNAMRALPDEDRPPLFGARETWLAGTATQLKPGDTLLFVGPQFADDANSNRWDARVLSTVELDDVHARTRVGWAEPLGSVTPFMRTADPPTIYALRDRAAIFGHNAVDWRSLSDDFKCGYLGLPIGSTLSDAQRAEWPQFDIFAPGSGGGLRVNAHVNVVEAANLLQDTVHASALSMAREGLASAGALGGAAQALVQRIAALPAHVGRASLEVAGRLPEAVGNVAQQVLVALVPLAGIAAPSVARAAPADLGSVGLELPAVPPVTGAAPSTFTPAPAPAVSVFANGLATLHDTLASALAQSTGFSSTLNDEIRGVGDDTRNLWFAQGQLLESAVAGSAAATALARVEADLALQPRLPFASVESLCDAVDAAAAEIVQRVPDYAVAAALSDPRVGTVSMALLAEVSPDELLANAQAAATLPQQLRSALARSSDPMQAALAAGAVLSPFVAAEAQAAASPLTRAVQRLHGAASAGAQRIATALSAQSAALRAGRLARVFASRNPNTISLDRDHTGIVAGSYALLSKPDYVELYRVSAAAQSSRAEFALAGKTSYLTLAGQNLSLFSNAVRETTVLGRSEALARARAPIAADVGGDRFSVAADVSGLQAGRRLLVKGPRSDGGGTHVHLATLVSATPAALAADGGVLVIDPPLPHALTRDGTVVFGNVALASHGETVAQILGAGDAARAFQRFELKQQPLTYRATANEFGAAAELTVRVGEVAWRERAAMFGAGATDRVYALTTDEQGRNFVVFGDGVHGARLAGGSNNVRASYRKGLGAAGNVRAETLTQLLTRPLGLKSVANPIAAEGGTDPETADAARQSMPLGTRTLGRAVSLLDYEDFARAFSGIAKAQARLLQLRAGPTIAITIAAPAGAPLTSTSPVWIHLLDALKAGGDPHVALQLLALQLSTFRLGLRVKRDPACDAKTVLAAVDAALRAAFSFDARSIGQPVQHSEVIAVAQAVPGVFAVDMTALYGGRTPAAQTLDNGEPNRRLLASRMSVQGGIALAAELLTLDASPLDRLEEMP